MISTATTIGEQWADYQAEVIPTDAPDVHREECKRAFYAGAVGMFAAVLAATEPAAADECEARLHSLEREMQDFLRLFKHREGL